MENLTSIFSGKADGAKPKETIAEIDEKVVGAKSKESSWNFFGATPSGLSMPRKKVKQMPLEMPNVEMGANLHLYGITELKKQKGKVDDKLALFGISTPKIEASSMGKKLEMFGISTGAQKSSMGFEDKLSAFGIGGKRAEPSKKSMGFEDKLSAFGIGGREKSQKQAFNVDAYFPKMGQMNMQNVIIPRDTEGNAWRV